MNFSFKTLVKMAKLDPNIEVEKVVAALNQIGFEVDNVCPFSDLEGLKFGRITKISLNPEDPKLNVCEVEFSDKKRIIQTNAQNVKEKMVIVACVPGSRIGKKTFASKKIKGIVSEGMMTSPFEFGIAAELMRPEVFNWIAHYEEVKDINLDPIKYLDLDDYIIEVDLLSNRSDAASYFIMALELGAFFGTKVTLPDIKPGTFEANVKVKASDYGHLTLVEAKNDFTISYKEQIFLAKHNIKSINDIVDLTNLTLLYSGQPVHSYNKVQVGTNFDLVKSSDKVTIFGNKEVTLNNNLMVTIDQKNASIASVIGLEHLSVKKEAKDLIFELGVFNSEEVRKSAKVVKLATEASLQGQKTLANGTTKLALAYLSSKLKTYANFVNYQESKNKVVKFDQSFINQLASKDLTKEKRYIDALAKLKILGFEFINNEVKVPSYRHDIETMQDIAEEIFRFYGYDNFEPIAPPMAFSQVNSVKNYKELMLIQGYSEVRTYTLISQLKNKFNPFNFRPTIKLLTYVSKEREVIRNSQMASLIEVGEYNYRRGLKNFSFISQGMINDGNLSLAFLSNQKDFRSMQKELLLLFPKATFVRVKDQNLHPSMSAYLKVNNKIVGFISKIHPQDSEIDAIFAEILLTEIKANQIIYQPYRNDSMQFEDITFALDLKEELGPKLKDIKAYSKTVIDNYFDQENKKRKITVRIVKEKENGTN